MRVPAQIFEVFCPFCGYRIEYPLFLSSFYSYSIYEEINAETFIRVDLEGVFHAKLDVDTLLSNYSKNQLSEAKSHKWINLEKTKYCHSCKRMVPNEKLRDGRSCLEEKVDVDTIP